jgi:hypothetical protein
MSWLRDQARQGMNPRTYVLLGLLVAALLVAQSLGDRETRTRLRSPGWGNDPFRRRFGPEGAIAKASDPARHEAPVSGGPGLFLQGVMNGPAGRTALINGEVYREGERVGSREILQIGARAVMLLDKGTVTTLTLKGDHP